MTLEVYKKIHKNDPVVKLAELMTDEAYYISCDARRAGWYSDGRNKEEESYWSREVEHHKQRVGWLYDTIREKMEGRE